jgi:Rps23 Pro-64 3,4-dihydroxylase Tpa1-like proline 4-hydroxylase
VADDVLNADAFTALGRELVNAHYESVHARGWDKAWRLNDGSALRGSAVYYDPEGAHLSARARYPTSSVVDEFIDSVRALTAEHPDVVGKEGAEWGAIFVSPWLYPVGSALSLHRDGGAYSGAFTFFAHPRWGIHWGGELLLLDEETPVAQLGTVGWTAEDDVGPGVATCVFPRPNRLVLVGPERPHMIGRVDVDAGDHVRTTLAGFFLRR